MDRYSYMYTHKGTMTEYSIQPRPHRYFVWVPCFWFVTIYIYIYIHILQPLKQELHLGGASQGCWCTHRLESRKPFRAPPPEVPVPFKWVGPLVISQPLEPRNPSASSSPKGMAPPSLSDPRAAEPASLGCAETVEPSCSPPNEQLGRPNETEDRGSPFALCNDYRGLGFGGLGVSGP